MLSLSGLRARLLLKDFLSNSQMWRPTRRNAVWFESSVGAMCCNIDHIRNIRLDRLAGFNLEEILAEKQWWSFFGVCELIDNILNHAPNRFLPFRPAGELASLFELF